MKSIIKVTFSNVSIGYECIRVYDSKIEALMRTNQLLLKHMKKYNTDEIFVRYESFTGDLEGPNCQDLLF